MQYWLFKSEPETFSIDHLIKCPKQTTHWEGVRNFQVRNMLRDDMKVGDLAFFYHSSCDVPGIAGIIKIVKAAYPDDTAWNLESHYYDPKSTPDNPRWVRVDVQLVEKFKHFIPLSAIRAIPALQDMRLLARGNRLSITPVSVKEWQTILKMLA